MCVCVCVFTSCDLKTSINKLKYLSLIRILSGLRIAPPEAPVTGYMFGKGVYFADMFSKSANYCYASHGSKAGVLLLCEVVFYSVKTLLLYEKTLFWGITHSYHRLYTKCLTFH